MEQAKFSDKVIYGLAALGVFFICDSFGILNAVRTYFGAYS